MGHVVQKGADDTERGQHDHYRRDEHHRRIVPGVEQSAGTQALRSGVIIAALGVVFGDIGTSPIYTLQTVFNPPIPTQCPSRTHTSTAWCR